MADVIPDPLSKLDTWSARWIIGVFDDACRALPNQAPSEKERNILAKYIVEAAKRAQWDRVKLKDNALAHLRSVMGTKN